MRQRLMLLAALAGLLAGWALPAGAAGPETAEVRSWPPPGVVVPGEATIVRQPDGISFTYSTSGFEAGAAHTIWFVAFNSPENCTAGDAVSRCGLGDLADPDVGATAVWGAGHVVGGSGKANLSGRVAVGDTSGCDPLGRLPCRQGLTNPMGADIHLVPRTHGPAIPGLVSAQIHSFNRGCEAGEPNVGMCANLQFAVFEAA
jgi:hypothetical protein